MSQLEHAPYIENIPAYALGALDGKDISTLEAHLKTCASCQAELSEYKAVTTGLLTAVPPAQPSAKLLGKIQNHLPVNEMTLRPQIRWSVGRLALGLALVMLLALNILAFQQMRQIQSQQANLVEQMDDAQVVLAMLSYPEVERLSVEGESLSGSFLLDPGRNIAVLIVWNMPQPPDGKTYQVWLIDSQGERSGAGVFNPKEDQAYTTQIIFSRQGFSDYVGIGVTVEPQGGSDQPTGDAVLKVDF